MDWSQLAEQLRKMITGPVESFEPMRRHTTLRVGGAARIFCLPRNIREMLNVLAWTRDNDVPHFVLGGGSNLLVADSGVEGLVIKTTSTSDGITTVNHTDEGDTVWRVSAGSKLGVVVNKAVHQGLGGLEKLAGIPGTVGGAVVMNAGANNSTIADSLLNVEVWDSEEKDLMEFDVSDCNFGYRSSIFQQRQQFIVVNSRLQLTEGDRDKLQKTVARRLSDRRQKQPVKWPSAGCVFRNPSETAAGYLIESAGWKGRRVGGAMVSKVHANFIVNCGGAKAEDVLKLIDGIRESIQQNFGIELELEIKTWGVTLD